MLNQQEAFQLYRYLIEARQIKEEEFFETRNPMVQEEIKTLRILIDRVFRLMLKDPISLN
jgi:hypothetical protein